MPSHTKRSWNQPITTNYRSFVRAAASTNESGIISGSDALGLSLIDAIIDIYVSKKFFKMMPRLRFVECDEQKHQAAERRKDNG